jgi:hypothetical protein
MTLAEYVVTREQVMALVQCQNDSRQNELLRSILGICDSIWKDLRCSRYDGHLGYHSSGQVDGAWASWERADG